MSELRLCPCCGALPIDWTDDPYAGRATSTPSAAVGEWQDASVTPPERVPLIAEYHEWNKPEYPLAYHVVWWCGGAYRPYPRFVGESFCDRWSTDLATPLPASPTPDRAKEMEG